MAHSIRLGLKTLVLGSNPWWLLCLSSMLCIWWALSWHYPPDTGFQIRSLVIWGSERYLSVTEIPHKKNPWHQSIGVGHTIDSGLLSVAILLWLSRKQCLPLTIYLYIYVISVQSQTGYIDLSSEKTPGRMNVDTFHYPERSPGHREVPRRKDNSLTKKAEIDEIREINWSHADLHRFGRNWSTARNRNPGDLIGLTTRLLRDSKSFTNSGQTQPISAWNGRTVYYTGTIPHAMNEWMNEGLGHLCAHIG